MIKLVNLTPHVVRIMAEDGTVLVTVKPDGTVARVQEEGEMVGKLDTPHDGWNEGQALCVVPVFKVTFGKVAGLPAQTPGVIWIVSKMVKDAVPERWDVLSPYGLVRDDKGQPIGCKGLC
jgi:hypothetical protein